MASEVASERDWLPSVLIASFLRLSGMATEITATTADKITRVSNSPLTFLDVIRRFNIAIIPFL